MKNSNRRSPHTFSHVPQANIQRSTFRRPFTHKTAFDAGYLIPFFLDEALPGDTHKVKFSMLARMATPIAPLMDNLYLDVHVFSVPLRLVWDNFQKFMGEQLTPASSTDYTVPVLSDNSTVANDSLADYFGIPPGDHDDVSCLPLRCYMMIWEKWFRDQNIIDGYTHRGGDGPDGLGNYTLQKRGKRHDYFTSCLPWPQKGTAVDLPLGTSAPVSGLGIIVSTGDGVPTFDVGNVTDVSLGASGSGIQDVQWSSGSTSTDATAAWNDMQMVTDADNQNSTLVADLSSATAATINSLREAFQLQKMMERDARGGTRYTEVIRNHFGVTSDDARQQRPEFLTGGTIPIQINPVTQTSRSETNENPQGTMAAFATAFSNNIGFTKSFTEHCYIIGLVSARADLTYQQGVRRLWYRSTKYDFYWPSLAHLGEQAVLNREIYHQNTSEDTEVFGYIPRYDEYRHFPSMISGLFRSTRSTPLDYWHAAQKFTSKPTLSQSFIEEAPPMSRILAVTDEKDFILDSYVDITSARPMPTYAVPGLIDHF